MENVTVTCPDCGTPSAAGKKFCAECGSTLPLVCPACGNPVTTEQKFCDECGTPLQAAAPTRQTVAERRAGSITSPAPASVTEAPRDFTAPAAPAEERRLVTTLFCDLVGFTPLSERLDPEEVRDVQTQYFAQMRRQVERYGGTVEKYAGDAVLALFGVPLAHEDDAERAVLCALGMQAAIEPVAAAARTRWDVEPGIRVGVNTGEVVSGIWDVGGRQDTAVTGDAVNTAARIQAVAEPGEVLVGLETMRLTKRRIQYGERRELVLKGKVGAIPGYPAIGIREQFGERWETSEGATPLVGRDRELLTLLDAWIGAQGGDGQLITLVGDAGVGKSRLVTELLGKVGTTSALRVVRGRCLSYGQEISLWLIADILRSLFGIREQDGTDEVRVKLKAGVGSLLAGTSEDTQAEAMDVLGEVMGLPPGPSLVTNAGAQIRRQALIRNLRLLLRALSERSPAIMVLEDLHWLDESSAEVLTEVLSDVPGLRLLVVAAQRPGWTAVWTDWGWTERLALRPLRDEEAAVLAEAVLGGKKLSPDLERYVADRAGGNPFFVEEMLRALQELGDLVRQNGQMALAPGAAERLPSTLTEVLLARLDRLDGEARSVAQVASVIGRGFAVKLLAHVTGQSADVLATPLTALQRAEIAFPRRGSDLEYVFKHISMREVAYNTLVQRRRQELHLQTARAIAALYPTDEYVEMIAYHYARTDEQGEAAEWLERAGDRAAAIYANETAIGNYQEARRRLELIGVEPVILARLDEKLGGVLVIAGQYDEALELLERAVETYREARELEAAGRATALIGVAHLRHGTGAEGIVRVQPMIELLSWSGPSAALAALHIALARLLQSKGRYQEMLEAAERASEIARAIGVDRLLGEAEERRGTALIFLGQPDEARQALEGAIPLLEAAGDLASLQRGIGNLGETYRLKGDLATARRYQERCLEICERAGDPSDIAFTLNNLGEILTPLGAWEEAQTYLERAQDVLDSMGSATSIAAYPPAMLGRLFLATGDWERAAQHLEEALSLARRTEDRQAIEHVETFLAELDVLEGRPEAARDRIAPLAAEPDADLGLLLPVLARAYGALGEIDRSLEVAQDAVRQIRELGEGLYLIEALTVQGMALIDLGRWADAKESLDEALPLAQRMPYPLAEGRILVELGRMHRGQGEDAAAQGAFEEALTIFRRLGARKDAEGTEQMLAALDRSPDPAR